MKPSGFGLTVIALTMGAGGLPVLAQNDSGAPSGSNSPMENAPIPGVIRLSVPKSGNGRLTTNKLSYHRGQPVRIAFTISNSTPKPVGYDYPTTEQFDVMVNNAQGTQVWDWAHGRVFTPKITHISLKPGQTRTYRVTWNGVDAQGKQVPPGVYTINARMTSSDRPAVTGNLLVNVDTDPTNMGFATRSPAENGVTRNIYPKPPLTASKTIGIGVPAPKSP